MAYNSTALTALRGDTHRGRFYRSVPLEHFYTMLSTVGAERGDNRYSTRTFAAASKPLYVAEEPDVAFLEAHQQFLSKFGRVSIPAFVVFPLEVTLSRVLDFTDDRVLSALGLEPMSLTGDWRSQPGPALTQRLGEDAFAAGFEAILYPSARVPGRTNLVLFTAQLAEGDHFRFDIPPDIRQVVSR
ncbi:MAG: RES family NAD+ phosphorylase [Deinococcus sp.]|nr:RES family NAD+ phosphorylase [Deinococcus sp.]